MIYSDSRNFSPVHIYPNLTYITRIIKIIQCTRGWLGGAKVSCILCHRDVELILAYSWARPVILVAGKGRRENVFISSVSSLSFLFLFLLCSSLSSLLSLSSISFLPFFGRRHKMTHKG